MNVGIDYDDDIDSENTIDRIEGVAQEEESEISTNPKIIAYSKAVRTGSG